MTSEPAAHPMRVPYATGLLLNFPDRSMEAAFWAHVFAERGRLLTTAMLLIIVTIPFTSPAFVPHIVDSVPEKLRWLDATLTTLAVGIPFLAGIAFRRLWRRDDLLVYFFTLAMVLVSINYCVLLVISGEALIGFYTYSMLYVLLISHLFLAIPFRYLLVTSTSACLAYGLTLSTFADTVPAETLLFALSPLVSFALMLIYVSYIIERSARVNFLYMRNLSREHQRRLERRENDSQYLALTADFLGTQLSHAVEKLAANLGVIRCDAVNPQQSGYLRRASDSVAFMDRLLGETYSSTALESTLGAIVTTQVDLSALVQLQVAAYRDIYPDHSFDVSARVPILATADRDRLLQALDKIVHNATEHSAPASMIFLSVMISEGRAVISVINEGSAPEDTERIFSPYVSSKRGAENVGIGLFVVRRIIESHGGTVRARVLSEPSRVEFLISLPLS